MGQMKCKDCKYFKIVYEPMVHIKECWDLGEAECLKHHLITGFNSKGKLERLTCVEEDKQCENGRQ